MFHWICPECGCEISPQTRTCPDCENLSARPVAAPQLLLAAPPAAAPCIEAPCTEVPCIAPAASVSPKPVQEATPVRPLPLAANIGQAPGPLQVAFQIADLPLAFGPAPERGTQYEPAQAPGLEIAAPQLRAGPPADPRGYKERDVLQGPVLAHELTSLAAAGVDSIMPLGQAPAAPPPRSSWVVSAMVASALAAAALGASMYALPGLASSRPPNPAPRPAPSPAAKKAESAPEPALSTNPLERAVEVTGIRFITDEGRRPEIHYLVVNHSNTSLAGIVVNVALHANKDGSPLSDFVFHVPRLGPYESKEMVSSIERLPRGVDLPDWRRLRTSVSVR